jgi:nifR3 family TIM-barrel protein
MSRIAREFAPADYRAFSVWPPVVLAPMAGVTNAPFRRLCRRYGAGLFVSEMITARGLVEGNRKTRHLASFDKDETPRSLQLYGHRPPDLAEATRRLVGEGAVDHLDLNFGCPVRKVTRQGGGAAIPAKPRLMASLVRAVVENARDVPVTVKVRKGLTEEILTYRDAGRVAEEEGAVAIGLHARTAAQLYDGDADWSAIADLKTHVGITVLGNGDVWEARDAIRMMRGTGCDGVIVGRGCLGRPWLFRDLADVFEGREPAPPPRYGEVREVMLRHAAMLVDFFGETIALRHMRRWIAWYTKGFPDSAALRAEVARLVTIADLEAMTARIPDDTEADPAVIRSSRAKRGGTQRVALPEGFLDDREDDRPPECDAPEAALQGG